MIVDACPLCGDRTPAVPWLEGRDRLGIAPESTFAAVRCRACDFHYLRTVPDDLGRHYPPEYYVGPSRFAPLARLERALLRRETRRLRRRLDTGVRAVLEIGPGDGRFLAAVASTWPAARLATYDISSVRLAPELAGRVEQHVGPGLHAAGFAAGAFDLVVLRHVVEHVPDLHAFLAEVRRITAPRGGVYVKTPNLDSLTARLFGGNWNGVEFPRHLYYFRPAELSRFVAAAGFVPQRLELEPDGMDWASSLQLRRLATRRAALGGGRWATRLAPRLLCEPVGRLAALLRVSGRMRLLARAPAAASAGP